jgi:tellurite resistance protein TerC
MVFWTITPMLLVIDFFVIAQKFHWPTFRQAIGVVCFFVSVGLSFGALCYLIQGPEYGLQYITAYIVEYSLSIDNLFVFIVIFSYFGVPRGAHHRCLFLGILGAVIFRLIFIFVGIEAVKRFIWSFIPLGLLLAYAAYKIVMQKGREVDPSKIWLVRIAKRFLSFSDRYEGVKFFVRREGKLQATPLFLVIVAIEGIDIIFAIDSVPAVLGITIDRLIAYSSNVFAIMGLRALYFVLATIMVRFPYLQYGLGACLGFIALKLILKPFHIEIATIIALSVVGAFLVLSALASIVKMRLVRISSPKEENQFHE